ncbi:FAD-binding and (Fe-S)-binding domain-containing protein [Aureibacter tunicatorum]|uniref:FAD/FMN-containing dehydrogenase/Fe-S oxidoreductase n=1 Tax=Aureibacter tunicatorum TaxID=866807 RepID=A0AAE4BUQ0_9BACT|nr:FAD-linked oxidase C-terminal domain-containing protein [Aureibacter tunicatorum]MDR6241032.1 FAD/FMN-containing dehydrogenase/Fe-S oxidoreductase [Aureibacter tunicatorum]BDD03810.1 oxidoreductase [Aureibacter tunicatorum]
MNNDLLTKLGDSLEGELYFDDTMKVLYATDASAYREMPTAVSIPKTEEDIKKLIEFAKLHKSSLIPRTAGTSLAGQVVGNGIVMDVSKYFDQILEVNEEEAWVRCHPGVVRDVLNINLAKHGLYYGPETSTANRAMVGGMVGNNSCGANSIVYGSARENLLELRGFLSDGSEVVFKDLSLDEFGKKCISKGLEGKIYRNINDLLANESNAEEIVKEYPKPEIPRRNTGYALDMLLRTEPFGGTEPFNFCKLIAGSEGTLMMITELKLKLHPLPPKEKALVCVHFESIDESLRANLVGLEFKPTASELIDHFILNCTKENIEQQKNRFFVEGEPGAILVIEISSHSEEERDQRVKALIDALKSKELGYHYPVLYGSDMSKIWALRKAGLGLLSNIPGDAKPAPVIEDTAVDVEDLPDYIADFNKKLSEYELSCVHYAHAGTGELHLRPILNLKTKEGNEMFHTIADEIAKLVKKYKGSLSGEHGDGRLRGEFIPFMIGEKNYGMLEQVKNCWDEEHIFNPNKIVNTPSMNSSLRYSPGQRTQELDTALDFTASQGYVRMAEMCNGSGDCRKTHWSGGAMCPSYMATKDEKHTTRARANIIREVLTHDFENPFADKRIEEVFDLCLSCKACKKECPSNVDVAKLKAEYLYQKYKQNGASLRTKSFAYVNAINKLMQPLAPLYNFTIKNSLISPLVKSVMGVAQKRSLPEIAKKSLDKWYKQNVGRLNEGKKKKVYLFCDEFTNYNEPKVGVDSIELLVRLGYTVEIIPHEESGRTFISKGILDKAKEIASKNVSIFSGLVSENSPLIGVEPSAILTFRDEYVSLLRGDEQAKAKKLAKYTFTIEEFLWHEHKAGKITSQDFSDKHGKVKVHVHCYQKALSSQHYTKELLSIPENVNAELIASGCCGMAGSFGYEKEHFEVSMGIGELVLFPSVRNADSETMIAAAGTSCRHQIKDGANRGSLHPASILLDFVNE